ncbi:MAG: DUF6476 family protein [Paracoccaceae bacterium]
MVQPHPVRDDDDLPEPPQVRRLRLLVSALIVVLIGGMVVVAIALVLRLGGLGGTDKAPAPVTAAEFALPEGAEVISLGRGPGEVLILTRDPAGAETLRVFDAGSGAETSATPITRE